MLVFGDYLINRDFLMKEQFSASFFFKTMNLIYIGYLVSGIIMLAISFSLWGFDFEIKTELSPLKKIVLGSFVILSTFISQLIYRRTLKRTQTSDQLIIKLQNYQSAAIYRLSILEFTLIITILFFIFTKLWSILIISCALLVLIFLCKPTKHSFMKLLPLTQDEKMLITQN